MPTGYRVRGGGGGAASPTSTFGDALALDDSYTHRPARSEIGVFVDAYRHRPQRNDPVTVADAYTMTTGASRNDTAVLDDAGRYQLTDLLVGRSGTPDTDMMSDAWVDQASTGTNHGNESLLIKQPSTAPGSDARRAYLQLNLTSLSGHTAGAAGATLSIVASQTGVTAASFNVQYATQASRWFTESTLTWANRPAGTPAVLPSVSVAAGAAATYAISIAQADLAAMLGTWVLFILLNGTAAAVPPTFTVLSRDNATASNRPKFSAALTIT